MSKLTTPKAVIDALEALYTEAVAAIGAALDKFLQEGVPPDASLRTSGTSDHGARAWSWTATTG